MLKQKPKPAAVIIWTIVIVLLASAQFPGILFYHDVAEPRILGMPFIYGFNFLVWVALCVVLYVAYRMRWGRHKPQELSNTFDAQEETK